MIEPDDARSSGQLTQVERGGFFRAGVREPLYRCLALDDHVLLNLPPETAVA